jgi:hypothetical protein
MKHLRVIFLAAFFAIIYNRQTWKIHWFLLPDHDWEIAVLRVPSDESIAIFHRSEFTIDVDILQHKLNDRLYEGVL